MCLILDELHKYVPMQTINNNVVLPNGDIYTSEEEVFFEILMGGDQVTVTRARSAISIRRTHDTNREKLRGIEPVIEDWHARMVLMQVI